MREQLAGLLACWGGMADVNSYSLLMFCRLPCVKVSVFIRHIVVTSALPFLLSISSLFLPLSSKHIAPSSLPLIILPKPHLQPRHTLLRHLYTFATQGFVCTPLINILVLQSPSNTSVLGFCARLIVQNVSLFLFLRRRGERQTRR